MENTKALAAKMAADVIRDLRTQLAQANTVIAERDAQLAAVNERLSYLEQSIIPGCITAIRQDAPVVALEALVQATRQPTQDKGV